MDEQHVGPPKSCAWLAGLSLLAVALFVSLSALGIIDAAKWVSGL